jgi:hypothetical protein
VTGQDSESSRVKVGRTEVLSSAQCVRLGGCHDHGDTSSATFKWQK